MTAKVDLVSFHSLKQFHFCRMVLEVEARIIEPVEAIDQSLLKTLQNRLFLLGEVEAQNK